MTHPSFIPAIFFLPLLYAQALYLLDHGEPYYFSKDETDALTAHNEEFRAPCNEEELLPLYFAPAESQSSDAIYMSATEIHKILIDYGHLLRPLPVNKFGALLQKSGFEKRSLAGGKKGYLVIQYDIDTVTRRKKEVAAQLQASMQNKSSIF